MSVPARIDHCYYHSEYEDKTSSGDARAEEEEDGLIRVFDLAAKIGDCLRERYLEGPECFRIRK